MHIHRAYAAVRVQSPDRRPHCRIVVSATPDPRSWSQRTCPNRRLTRRSASRARARAGASHGRSQRADPPGGGRLGELLDLALHLLTLACATSRRRERCSDDYRRPQGSHRPKSSLWVVAPEPLEDGHGRLIGDLRVSVTDRCNFRCQYCMPAEGLPWLDREEILSFEEIARIVELLSAMGVQDVRLTGGEPLVRRNFPQLAAMLASLPNVAEV